VIRTLRSDATLHQYLGVLTLTWNAAKNLNLKSELAVLRYRYTGAVGEQQTTFRAIGDVNYAWKNFMLNLTVRAKEKRLSNAAVYESDFVRYGANIRWSTPGWHIEVGTNNPFAKRNTTVSSYYHPVYSYDTRTYSKTQQQTAYVKVVYRLSRGKRQQVEAPQVDTGGSGAIMKVR
jgi:hypothetical protein